MLNMADEDLIYRMTKAVYGRLGAGADARLVEDLVTDLYGIARSGQDAAAPKAGGGGASGARLIVTAFGANRPGVVAVVASTLADAGYNIADMNQTVVEGKFAMVLLAEAEEGASDLGSLKDRLNGAAERLGVRIYTQREDLFQSMHRV
jgi:ACT domain-containing protein